MVVRKFDWSRLSHAHGPATDVPVQLAALFENDRARSEEALAALSANMFRANDVSDATAVTTLLLGDELAAPAPRQAAACLQLLARAAHAARSWGVCPPDQAEAALQRLEQGAVAEVNQPEAWQACWGALRRVLPHVVTQLGSRFGDAALFIAELGIEAPDAHDALRRAPATDAERAPLLAALLCSADSTQRRALPLELDSQLGASSDEVRAIAAYGLVALLGPRASESAVVALADAALEGGLPDYLPGTSFADLARLLGERGVEFMLWLVQRCGDYATLIVLLGDALRFVAKLSVPGVLARGVDPDGVPSVRHDLAFLHTREQLSPAEIRVWRAALANPLLWSGRTDLFAKLGLPDERRALEALLAEQAATIN